MHIRTAHSPEPRTCPRHHSGSLGRGCAQSGSGSYPSCVPHARSACNLNVEQTMYRITLSKLLSDPETGTSLGCHWKEVWHEDCDMLCLVGSSQCLAPSCCVPVHFARPTRSACCSSGVSSRSPSACTTCSSLLWPCSRCLTTARACMPLRYCSSTADAVWKLQACCPCSRQEDYMRQRSSPPLQQGQEQPQYSTVSFLQHTGTPCRWCSEHDV